MALSDNQQLQIRAHEAFILRAFLVGARFMLKGSYLTRQYFPEDIVRIPADLDWFYIDRVVDIEREQYTFNSWVQAITDIEWDDGVRFQRFVENQFWRSIDYAMHDDFPTINTDITCWVDGVRVDFSIDLSFNLPLPFAPVPLIYRALNGAAFTFPYTVPLSLQVSWKIHQTLVRPRFKDLFDLIYLVSNKAFDTTVLQETAEALVQECKANGIKYKQVQYFFEYEIEKLFPAKTIKDSWSYWRTGWRESNSRATILYERAKHITDPGQLPQSLPDFLQLFQTTLMAKGLTPELIMPFKERLG
ncbi:MAG: nucleotidyl transferase AbiEii/AbiGii toxin family protein [Taibaiella sp.]|nr:nucleotidyl transferase AbiEii/AbiGii toxin family protein [Taibaiella sp.]